MISENKTWFIKEAVLDLSATHPEIDISSFSFSLKRDIEKLIQFNIPFQQTSLARYLESLKNKKKHILILDASWEFGTLYNGVGKNYDGSISGNLLKTIKDICKFAKFPFENVIWITGNLIDETKGINRLCASSLMQWTQTNNEECLNEFVDKFRHKHFMTLNGNPREHRLILVDKLIKDNIFDKGYVSCNPGRILLSQNEYRKQQIVSEDDFKDILKQKHIYYLDNGDLRNNNYVSTYKGLPTQYWKDSCFSVVCETNFITSDKTKPILHTTEKTFKIFDNFHMGIWFATPGLVTYLRDNGFDVFDDIINHTYDEIEDDGQRFSAAYLEVYKLCQYGKGTMNEMYHECADRLVANKERLQTFTDEKNKEYKRALIELINDVLN